MDLEESEPEPDLLMDRVNLNLVLGEEDVGCSVNRSWNLK